MLLVCVLINNSFTVHLCFCFYLIPIKMLLVCVDIKNLRCRTFFYFILVGMLLVYVLVNNSVSFLSLFLPRPHQCAASVCGVHNSFRPYLTLSPSVGCWFVCYWSSVSLLYILFYGQSSAWFFFLLFFYPFSIKMLLCCCWCCFNYLLLSFLLEAYLNK